jgi:hypothetical protein
MTTSKKTSFKPSPAVVALVAASDAAQKTSFQLVAEMNEAFGNPKGDFDNINEDQLRSQILNIHDEYLEVLSALGLDEEAIDRIRTIHRAFTAPEYFNKHGLKPLNKAELRDGLCDIQVFAMGAQHRAGVDGDRDMQDVISGVMTRFIKDEADKEATIALHAAKGVTDVYFEGEYPKMVMKSASDQPDAPKGKFLKSASYQNTVFRPVPGSADVVAAIQRRSLDVAEAAAEAQA